jgi:UDP-sulfoquinovose synthase
MKILVLGGDGYCGWATALYLCKQRHWVAIVDNFIRRQWDHELEAQTLTPIRPLTERLKSGRELRGLPSIPTSAMSRTTSSCHPSLSVLNPRP